MTVTRTFDLLERLKTNFPSKDALAGKYDGTWIKFGTDQYIENVNNVSYGLLESGVRKGDKIATIFSNNRPEWNFLDFGISQIGAVHVPVYPTISDDDQKFILEHSDAVYVFVSDKNIFNKIKPFAGGITAIKKIYSISKTEGADCWTDIIELGRANASKHKDELEKIKSAISSHDLLTIIYTSGTTGTPKGVMLTHNNLVTNFIETSYIQPLEYGHKILSFLPLCHVYERMMTYHFQYKGISIYYAENPGAIMDNIKEIKPDGFNTVPLLLERIYLKIVDIGKDLTGIKKKIFFWALDLGFQYELKGRSQWYELKRKIADTLVFSKWRKAIGGNVKIIVCGGSSLQPRLSRIFWAAGIPILEGYGLTETSPVIAVSHYDPDLIKFGAVGPVLKGVQVKLDEDGEILCKGPNVMPGYYKDPEYTQKVVDKEGWFHTGDIGAFEDKKFLKITDRKKEIFKLSSGKYIAPQVIENKFKASTFINNIMVAGENKKFAGAIISPNFTSLHSWALKHKIHFRDNKALVQNPEVIARIQEEVNEINETLGHWEHIKRFRLVYEEWSPLTGELSPTLKLKRKALYAKYDYLLKEIYGNPE
ncbi:MAG: long-chain fatty acid--CoA ligase [Bacteroidia bacterium]|nr:long-chain fatty acid--CoA ligase [Bacteroidia bacterium]